MTIIVVLYRVLCVAIVSFSIAIFSMKLPSIFRVMSDMDVEGDIYFLVFMNYLLPIVGPITIGLLLWYIAPFLAKNTIVVKEMHCLPITGVDERLIRELLFLSISVTSISFAMYYLSNFLINVIVLLLTDGIRSTNDIDWVILLDGISAFIVGVSVLIIRDVFLSFWNKRKGTLPF